MWDTFTSSDGKQDGRAFMDGSGWTVSTGRDTRASGGDRVQTNDNPMMQAASGSAPAVVIGGTTMSTTTIMLIAGAVVLAVVLLKRRKG